MKRIELYHSTSGDVHLYEIDFERPAMTEIARGKFGKELGFGYLLGENEESVSFYQSVNDKWRVVPVHTTDVGVLFGEIVYCRKDVWYAYLDGKEILLGTEKKCIASSLRHFSDRSRWYECYFIQSHKKSFTLSVINSEGKLMQKEYPGDFIANKEVILAPIGSGYFDAYRDAQQLLGGTEVGEPYFKDDEGNIYFWSEAENSWRMLPLGPCSAIAHNAVLEVSGCKTGPLRMYYLYTLYQIDADASFKAIRRGKVHFLDEGIRIGGWVYEKNYYTDKIDFEHPRRKWWLKIKNFFGLSKK